MEIEGQPTDYRDYLGTLVPDYLIIVCDSAAKACPVWSAPTERLLWPFEDPAAAEGSEQEKLERFRAVRDQIHEKIKDWAAGLPRDA